MIHTTIGVYLNGDFVVNGVTPENLESHIQYNLTYRPGRVLLVDGKVVNRGYYREEEIPELEEKFKEIKKLTNTAPYR